MALIADTSGIYALYDADDRAHEAVKAVFSEEPSVVIVSAAILAEVDYLLTANLGVRAGIDFLEGLNSGAFALEQVLPEDLHRARELLEGYADLNLGLADAATIATAERRRIRDVLTLDERHFRTVRPKMGPFRLLPTDRD